ncbi:MAG: N-acetyl-gamma-glutamyl-phosphate reductase [Eubacteriales bacterium]
MKPKIYIDGKEGTTGLQIYERLGGRDDIELLLIDEDKRKDIEERRKFLNAADIAFLCLPDAAAREAVSLIENDTTRVIDASTAHRTDPDWDYGFAELSKAHREAIKNSKRVANPGCHASGFISSVYPLVANGIIAEDTALTCASLTGYSGGGKKMIAEYQDENRDPRHDSERIYGLNLHHKHLPEMGYICGLTQAPVFVPIVGDFYKGMATTVMLPGRRRTPCARNACQALRGSAARHRGAVRRGRADDLRQHAGRSRQLKAHCLRPRGADDRHRAV